MNGIDSANGASITFVYSRMGSGSDLPKNFIPLGTPVSISYTFNSGAPSDLPPVSTVPDGTGFGTIAFCLEPTGSCLNCNGTATLTPTPSVPLPGAAFLFLSELIFAMVLLAKETIVSHIRHVTN